ncbi:MAG TPA: tyrosine-type recombinase/integrase, partial [Inquilinus sp.]
MVKITLKHINKFNDRHGTRRVYLRVPGCPSIQLFEPIGSPAFMTEYNEAMKSLPIAVTKPKFGKPASVPTDRTIAALAKLYETIVLAKITNPSTLKNSKGPMDAIVRDHGHRSVILFDYANAAKIHADLKATPASANSRIRVLSDMMDIAIKQKWRTDNPCDGIKPYKGGHHATWTNEQLAQFEERWALGTAERTAFELMAWTSQRIGDAFLRSWSEYRELDGWKMTDEIAGWFTIQQKKTRDEEQDRTLTIPVPPELAVALAAWRDALRSRDVPSLATGEATILINRYGNPFSQKSVSAWFAEKIEAAGLPTKCVAHGIRKAACKGMADGGASNKAMQAVSGHRNSRELDLYTQAADQPKLAAVGVAALRA